MSVVAQQAERLSPRKRQLLELMLAERKAEKRRAVEEDSFPRADRSRPLPLSFVQQRLWFLSQLDETSPAYNIPAALYLNGPLDAGLLETSYNRILERHEDLRTNFLKTPDGEPYAVVTAELELGEAEEVAQHLVPAVTLVPFDLTRDALVRLRLIRLAPEAHVLLLVVHHVIADVWSIGVFFREIGAFYDALVAGGEPALPPLALQYADYVIWQQERLEKTGELDRQLEYWIRQLAGVKPVVDLPTDFPRPPMQTVRGVRYGMHVGGDAHERLQAIAKPEEASLYMATLAVFFMLLYRYTGQREILVGTPMANRNRVEFEPLIGFFVNTVVLAGDLGGDPSFRQLLRQVRATALEAFTHHDLPFERVVNALKLERDLSRNPLYQVDFAFQNLPSVELETPGLSLRPFTMRETTSRFDLELDLKEAADGFEGFIRYNTALFAAPTIERMARHYRTLLEGVIADPDLALSRLPLLGDAELDELLFDWNDTAAECRAVAAHHLIESWAARTPDAPALIGPGGEPLSFPELDRRAGRLARRLLELGTTAESVVALAMPRGLELPVALLAVWKAGAAYLPLDLSHPPARLRFLLRDAGVRRVLTDEAVRDELELLAEDGREVLCIGDAAAPEAGPAVAVEPGNAAYVIYTSGSTGRPKGVVVPHRGLVNYLDWCLEAYGLDAGAGSLVHSPLGFDLTVTSLVAPLAAGRPVRLLAEDGGIEGLAGALREASDLSLIKITPAHLESLAELLEAREAPALGRTVVIGGEALYRESLDFWLHNAPHSRLVNEYGPTEAVVGCSVEEVTAGAAGDTAGVVPIGRPIRNARLHVVDADLNLTPRGVPGELLIGGAGVARGYLGRPGLTGGRFVPDPFALAPGERLYRSGDRARRLPDGRLVFLGRLDHQVKVRGYRIEVGEVEAALGAHPDVQAAAVAVRDDTPGGADLVAWVAAPRARNLGADPLRAFLAESLPEYMVPAFFVFLPALPLTANGKVDRRALPAPGAASADRDADFVAPRTPTENQVAQIWAEVLKVDRVSVNDRFFDLGGQSMLAVQVISRVRDRLQADVPVQSLFNETTVASLASTVEAARARGSLSGVPPVAPAPRDAPLPLSFSQERLWFLEQLVPGLVAYNVSGGVSMQGDLDPSALASALDEIVRRHEVMRTTFEVHQGEPVQKIHPELRIALPLVDLAGLPGERRRETARALARAAAGSSFDLVRGPLLRQRLIRLAADEHLFVLVLHQIVYDMWSRDLFLGELVTLYQAFSAGRPAHLPEPQLQYADYAWWQRRYLTDEALEPQLAYWMEQLAGLRPVELAADRRRPEVQTMVGKRRRRTLPAELTRTLKKTSRRGKVTLFVTLLSAFDAFLYRYTAHPDVAVGSPVANRNRVETEGLLGFFANTVVLRVPGVHAGMKASDLFAEVKTTSLNAFANQDIAFERLVNKIQPQRDMSRQPLFQVLFNFLINYQPPTVELPGLKLIAEEVHPGGVPFDLMVAMYEFEGRLNVVCDYSTDLFDATTVERLLRHFEIVLASLARDPRRTLGELDLVSPPERHQLLAEWSDSRRRADRAPVHRLFEGWAERTSETVAVACGGESLDYGELNRRANRLARRLVARGVEPEAVVAVLAERGPDFLSAILATFKAGGAYLPLNPLHPEARSAQILRRSGARLVLAGRGHADGLRRALAEAELAAAPAVLDLEDALAGRPLPEEDAPPSGDDLPIEPAADNLAYVIFTSGSTGIPKGVMVTHRGMRNHLWVKIADLGLSAADLLAQTAAQTFDISVWQFLAPLMVGGRVVVYPDAVAQNPLELFPAVVRDGVTGLESVPALAEAFLGAPEGAVPAHLGDLRWLMLTGEALKPALTVRWFARYPGIPLWNAYGPAECSDDVTHFHLRRALDPETCERTPIGRAVANLALRVTDRRLQPVPAGVFGELLAAGAGVGRGYLADPRRTARSFIPDPFSGEPGGRLYRTGDLVRFRAGGLLEFAGRVDHQVKIRGFRIEPGEIEAVTMLHPQVQACAVLSREDKPGDLRLAAYVVPADGAELDVVELRRAARAALPDYMVPSAYVVLDSLPLTDHGKLDRQALPAPGPERPELEAAYVAPRTPLEEALAAIWMEVLDLEKVGVHDDFFDLGGHSLLVTQVVSRVAKTLEVEVPLRDFFDRSTVADLAATIEAVRWVAAEPVAAVAAGEEEGEL